LEIRLAGEKVYDNSGESLLEVYKDLWLRRKQRDDMVEDAGADPAPELTDAYIRPHGGSGGILPREILKSRTSEIRFPAF
jgi:hypothetical protein